MSLNDSFKLSIVRVDIMQQELPVTGLNMAVSGLQCLFISYFPFTFFTNVLFAFLVKII